MSSDMTITMSSCHSPPFPSLHQRHNSFSNPSVALPTSQLILQPFRCFTYVTAHSPTLLSLPLRHKLFIWRATHAQCRFRGVRNGIWVDFLRVSPIFPTTNAFYHFSTLVSFILFHLISSAPVIVRRA